MNATTTIEKPTTQWYENFETGVISEELMTRLEGFTEENSGSLYRIFDRVLQSIGIPNEPTLEEMSEDADIDVGAQFVNLVEVGADNFGGDDRIRQILATMINNELVDQASV